MARTNHTTIGDLSQEISRTSRSAENRRFLRGLPWFQIDRTLPDRLQSLLETLDRVEVRKSKQR